MVDPFLLAHKLGPRYFSIGGKVSPVAVRDQMVRAELFVQRAHDQGYLRNTANRPILIVGAGVAGASAALHASQRLGIRTHLAESGAQPFTVQSNCSTRWLDPTLYDFPVDHWNSGQYPPHYRSALPYLAWGAGYSSIIALRWYSDLFTAVQSPESLLEFKPRTTLIGPPVLDPGGGDFVRVTLEEDGTTKENQEYALVLLAVGPGRERTYLEDAERLPLPTRGYPFWIDDPIGSLNCGLSPETNAEVIISGSGDGALQDFLRVTTNCTSPRDIYLAAPLSHPQLCELHSAQRRAERVLTWGHSTHTDHAALAALHQAVERATDARLAEGGEPLKTELRKLLRRPLPKVHLLFGCTHFGNCYLINHYLSLLIARIVAEECGVPVLMPQRRLKIINGANGHACVGNPDSCYGQPHIATPMVFNDCRGKSGADLEPITSNIVIIRHGTALDEFAASSTPAFRRHLLPFFLPD